MDNQSGKYMMWPKGTSWIDQLRSQPCSGPLGSAAYSFSGREASWEEQAFAEDTLMHVWPPRSYSCTFCRREFRSAQALGGHMNVHRRDRARLRQQQPSSPNTHAAEDQDHRDAHSRSPDNCSFYPSSTSAVDDRKPKDPNRSAAAQTGHGFDGDEVLSVPNDLTRPEAEILDVGNLKRKDQCKADKLEDRAICAKRRCVVPSESPWFSRSSSSIQLHQLQNEVTLKSTACPVEEIDLELRLGNCPTVT